MTKQELVEMVDKAERLAIKAHAGQKDKAGKDYFEAHVAVVANGIIGDPIAKAVAFLHDTVEDTSVTIEDIKAEFPKKVADAVDVLTQFGNFVVQSIHFSLRGREIVTRLNRCFAGTVNGRAGIFLTGNKSSQFLTIPANQFVCVCRCYFHPLFSFWFSSDFFG